MHRGSGILFLKCVKNASFLDELNNDTVGVPSKYYQDDAKNPERTKQRQPSNMRSQITMGLGSKGMKRFWMFLRCG